MMLFGMVRGYYSNCQKRQFSACNRSSIEQGAFSVSLVVCLMHREGRASTVAAARPNLSLCKSPEEGRAAAKPRQRARPFQQTDFLPDKAR